MRAHSKGKTSKLEWFGVKTIFRTTVCGKPEAKDASYSAGVTLVEDRVVLFRARDFDHSIHLAEKEARSYARKCGYVNPYGQRVVTRYLGACDTFNLFDPPGIGIEVFSTTEIVPKRVSDKTIVDRRLGNVKTDLDYKRRRNFLNCIFSGRVKRRIPTACPFRKNHDSKKPTSLK